MRTTAAFLLLACSVCLSCKNNAETKPLAFNEMPYLQQLDSVRKYTGKDSVLSNDYDFIFDSIFKGKVKIDMSQYENHARETKCLPRRDSKANFREFLGEIHNLGDIDGDHKNDSVFILDPLNICEEMKEYGQSYYFTNGLPRIDRVHPVAIRTAS